MSKSIILQREDGTGYIAVFLAQDSEAVAVGNGFDNYTQDHNDGQIRNAFAHTHKSAEILFNYDRTLAETLGNWKEDTPLTIDEADEYRDQYNNELGRKLAEYLNTWLADEDLQGRTYTDAEKEGFLDDLVYDAYVSGDMIWDLENDPRITIDSFESDPSQYQTPAADVIWTDPTANWQESSANRNYSHVDDFNENPIGFALALPEVAAAYANNTYNSLQELLTEVYSTASDWVNALPSWYTNTITWFGVTFAGAWDPLVIDLDGDGVQADYIEATFTNGGFTRVNPVNFDLDADGFAESATWHGDGFLVRDLNGNGRIDNGGELFGNASADGFTMLAQYDDNLDGVINAQDAIWGDLQIWHDANADAKTQASELISLSSLDITGIDLSAVATGSTNDLTHTGTVYTGTGTLEAGNYNFITEAANTRYAQNYDFDIRAAFLPTLRGYNQLPDLHIALSLDNDETNPDSLMAIILDIASYSFTEVFENWDTVKGKIEDLLYRWAGVENVLQNSRGDFIADARQLEFLEAHLGDQFIDNNGWGGNPQSVQALEFQDLWETQIFPRLAGAVLLQTQASKLTGSSITYDFADDDLVGTNVIDQLVLDQLVTAAIALPDTASREAFWLGVGELLAFSTGATDGGELLGYSETEQLKLKTAIENSDSSLTWDMADHDPLNGITSIEYRLFNPSGETITGDENDNSYYSDPVYGGTANDDTIYGLGGNDVLLGGLGSDAIYGGTGNDELYGQGGNDILDGGDGNDILAGGGGDAMDTVIGGAGNDILRIDSYTGGGQVLAQGGDGDDTYEVGREAWLDETTGSGLDTIILNSSQSEATLIYERHGDDMQVWLNSGFFTIRDHFNHGPV
ncbi:MAG: calcium-binding protein, partial [Candidatus Thiodiazotropha endolucinida]